MTNESPTGKRARKLRTDELAFLRAMLAAIPDRARFEADLSDVLVEDMPDGGMGGLFFVNGDERKRKFGRVLVEAEFEDEDGIGVLASIFLDEQGSLLELDVFKGDFSPLERLPLLDRLRVRKPTGWISH